MTIACQDDPPVGDDPEAVESLSATTDIDDDLADADPDTEFFDPTVADSRAVKVDQTVAAAFSDDLSALDTDDSSLILAQRQRTCAGTTNSSDSCGDWELDVPLDGTVYEVDGVMDDIEWELMFERATPRAMGRALDHHVGTDERVNYEDGQKTVVHEITISPYSMDGTIEDARERSYERANERSWNNIENQTAELEKDDDELVSMSLTFDEHVRVESQHSINWFDIDDTDNLGVNIQAENQDRLDAAQQQSKDDFEQLGLCEWKSASPSTNSANVECTVDDLEQLVEEQPDFIAGIYHNATFAVAGGGDYREESASRMGNYLDVTPYQHTGNEPSPSGNSSVKVAYADLDGFYEVDEHPAFRTLVCLINDCYLVPRVTMKKECSSSGCHEEWNQGGHPDDLHGAKVIGAFSSILNDQDASYPGSDDKEDRSYGAYGTDLRLYDFDLATGWEGVTAALYDASEETAEGFSRSDIWGLSASAGDCQDPRAEHQPWTEEVDNAHDRGIFMLHAAGNTVDPTPQDDCRTNGTVTRTDIATVGAFGQSQHWEDVGEPGYDEEEYEYDPAMMTDYDSEPLMGTEITDLNVTGPNHRCPEQTAPNTDHCWSSADGGADIYVDGQVRDRGRTVVDITAPTGRGYSAIRSEQGDNDYKEICCGTSFATPKAAAAAASIRDWGYDRNHSLWHDPTVIYVMMLLSGDFTGNRTVDGDDPVDQHAERPEGDYEWRRGFSRIWGAGRLHAHRLSGEDGRTLESPYAWVAGNRTFDDTSYQWTSLSDNPTPTDTEEIAGVFAWEEPGLSGESNDPAARIWMGFYSDAPETDGTCPSEPSSNDPELLLGDYSYDTKRRIALGPDFISWHSSDIYSQCIYMAKAPWFDPPANPDPEREGAFVMYRQGAVD